MKPSGFKRIASIRGVWDTCLSFQEGRSATQYKNGDTAATCGHLSLFKLSPGMKTTPLAVQKAAEAGDLELVRRLHEFGAVCTSSAMDQAAANGHLKVVEFLHYNRSEGASVMAMNLAAGNGHIHVLDFLQKNRREGCTPLAYSLAASNGKIESLEWLKNNTQCKPGPFAMDEAAAKGQVGALEWLHKNGCMTTPRAIDRAARNGHLETVKWLIKNSFSGFTYCAVEDAATHGHQGVLLRLFALCKGKIPSSTLTLAAIHGHVDIVVWLVVLGVTPDVEFSQVCTQIGRTDLLRFVHTLAESSSVQPRKLKPFMQRSDATLPPSEDSAGLQRDSFDDVNELSAEVMEALQALNVS